MMAGHTQWAAPSPIAGYHGDRDWRLRLDAENFVTISGPDSVGYARQIVREHNAHERLIDASADMVALAKEHHLDRDCGDCGVCRGAMTRLSDLIAEAEKKD